MSPKRSLSVMLLMVLTTLPVLGVLCVTRCHPSEISTEAGHNSAHQHAGAHHTHIPDRTSMRLLGVSGHDCGSHDLALSQASTAAERTDGSALSMPVGAAESSWTSTSPAALRLRPEIRRAADGAPPTAAPLVLRV